MVRLQRRVQRRVRQRRRRIIGGVSWLELRIRLVVRRERRRLRLELGRVVQLRRKLDDDAARLRT